MVDALAITFSVIGNLAGIFMAIGPWKSISEAADKKDTNHFSYLPFFWWFGNSVLWVCYAVVLQNVELFILNGIFIVATAHYSLIVFTYGENKGRNEIISLVGVLLILVYFALFTLVGPLKPHIEFATGILCTIGGAGMYATPLGNSINAIRTRSVAPIPIIMSITALIFSSVWVVYGIIQSQLYLLIANSPGVLINVFQIILYFVIAGYNRRRGNDLEKNLLNKL